MELEFLKIEKENETEFKSIANKILNEYAIENHESKYRILELEFYWNSPRHKDESTYKRKHVNPDNGTWFFHYSGVDIALKNEEINGHGGILIRKIYSVEEDKIYNGPMVSAMKLFSGTSVSTNSIQTKLISYPFEKKELCSKPRTGLGNNAKETRTDKLNYNYFIKL